MSLNYVALKNLHAQVLAWLEQGIPQKAKQKLDELTFEEKDNLFVEYLLGICEQELGNRERAIRHFKYVISQDPSFVRAAEALFHLAEDSLSIGEKKYLCQIIHFHKPDDVKIAEFLKKYADTPTELILKPLQSAGEPQLIDDDASAAAEETIKTKAAPHLELTEENPQEQTESAITDEIETPPLESAGEKSAKTEPVAAETTMGSQPKPEETPIMPAVGETEEPASLQEPDLTPEKAPDDESPQPETVITTEAPPKPEQATDERPPAAKDPQPNAAKSPTEAEAPAKPETKNLPQKNKTRKKIASYETLTMAQVYKEQGLFEQALAILEKLAENAIDPERIQQEISKVKKLMEEKANQ